MIRVTLATALVSMLLLSASSARADDCPPGSKLKTEEGFSWCEPSVCTTDITCGPGEVCAPYPLCVQVGTTKQGAALGDAGKRLVATQRCGPDNECPDTTVCSNLSRCVAKVIVERNSPKPATTPPPSKPGGDVATSSASAGDETKKSSCGCHVPGAASPLPFASAPALLAVVLVLARTRRRIRPDPGPLLG
jgi:MYXO-CTERM domain-containing protein